MAMKTLTVYDMPKTKTERSVLVSTNWLISPYAGWFFLNHNWTLNSKSSSVFASISDSTNPVTYVSEVF